MMNFMSFSQSYCSGLELSVCSQLLASLIELIRFKAFCFYLSQFFHIALVNLFVGIVGLGRLLEETDAQVEGEN